MVRFLRSGFTGRGAGMTEVGAEMLHNEPNVQECDATMLN